MVRWTLLVASVAIIYTAYCDVSVFGWGTPRGNPWYIACAIYIVSGVAGVLSFLTLLPPRKVAESILVGLVGSLFGLVFLYEVYHPGVSLFKPWARLSTPRCMDSEFGTILVPNIRLKHTDNGFSVTFSTDGEGRRITPAPKVNSPRGEIRILGCSFTMGTGVDDDETWSSELARQLPNVRVWNYGCEGWGTTQVALKVRKMKAKSLRVTVPTLFLYGFIPDHVRRNAKVGPLGSPRPKVELTKGDIVFQGVTEARDREFFTPAIVDEGEKITRACLSDMDQNIRSMGGHFALVFLDRVDPKRKEKMGYDYITAHWWGVAEKILADLRIPIIDLRETPGDILPDAHPGPIWHRNIGQAVARHPLVRSFIQTP